MKIHFTRGYLEMVYLQAAHTYLKILVGCLRQTMGDEANSPGYVK
jgi:hypothetical protein